MGASSVPLVGLAVAPRAEAATSTTRERLSSALGAYLSSRTGPVGVALVDHRTGTSYAYNSYVNQTLSTVKVLIGMAVLRQAQERRTVLTPTQQTWMSAMIRSSNNAATDALLGQVGVANVQRVANDLGMRATRVQGMSSGWWGYSTSTPIDMATMERRLTTDPTMLTTANVRYLRGLMATVTLTQRWGVLGSLPSGLAVAENKNGWGPMAGGYRLNSVGHVTGFGRNYSLALYSRSPLGYADGVATLDRVGRIVYDVLAATLDPLPPRTWGRRRVRAPLSALTPTPAP